MWFQNLATFWQILYTGLPLYHAQAFKDHTAHYNAITNKMCTGTIWSEQYSHYIMKDSLSE